MNKKKLLLLISVALAIAMLQVPAYAKDAFGSDRSASDTISIGAGGRNPYVRTQNDELRAEKAAQKKAKKEAKEFQKKAKKAAKNGTLIPNYYETMGGVPAIDASAQQPEADSAPVIGEIRLPNTGGSGEVIPVDAGEPPKSEESISLSSEGDVIAKPEQVEDPFLKEEEEMLTREIPLELNLQPYIGRTITLQIFSGNTVVTDNEIRSVLKTKPGMEFTEMGLSEDLSAIYEMGWFYDMRPEFRLVPEGVEVNYHVMENPIYERLEVKGNTVIAQDKIDRLFDMPAGHTANLKDINTRVQKLEELYRADGYILARVSDVHMAQDGTLSITANESIVEDFKVKGNKKCKDYVITREMRLKKGEPFNAKLARRSMQRIYNLGFFEDVNVRLNPGREENGVEVEISVVEMNTGTFGVGAGYSDADGFIGMISIGDKNFRGTGDSVMLRWEFGGEDDKNYDLTYVKPWIDKHETQASINLYDITAEYADYDIGGHEIARYDKKRRGQEITMSWKTHNEFISNYLTLKNRDDIYDGQADGYNGDTNQYYEPQFNNSKHWKDYYPTDYRERRKENFGRTRSVTIGRVYDSRDNQYDPHAGKRIGYSVEWAGLGGDFTFTKLTADGRYYYRAGRNQIWAWNLVGGYAHGDMPLSQRFSMGGSDTLRGYEDDQFRGNSLLKATLEYRFPLAKRVQGGFFIDNGYAWDKRHEDYFDLGLVKTSGGFGIRINSPLGPIKLDYGYGDAGGKFHFSFGGQF
ncbi:MAG: BamA/TamA family outer membrane protein [Phascolarctobacterium sp.]|nr:BamA/TamA family outer membrane protein [Phascolarctobacterium sp.]